MIGQLDIYSLKLTPDNTLYFNSVEEQTAWFDENVAVTVPEVSFNGSRAFSFSSNYLDMLFSKYNYVRYKLNDKYVYAFIENILYNNDNSCSLKISIDLVQTFFFDIQNSVVTSNIRNKTEDTNYFKQYRPYTNKYQPDDFNSYNVGNFAQFDEKYKLYCGFILVNCDPKLTPIFSEGAGVTDNGYPFPVSCFAFPVFYNLNTINPFFGDEKVKVDFFQPGSEDVVTYYVDSANLLTKFINEFSAYIINIGITFNPIAGLKYNGADNIIGEPFYSGINKYTDSSGLEHIILQISNNEYKYSQEYNLTEYLKNIPLSLLRNPYVYIRVGTDTESIELNLLDFFNYEDITTDSFILKIEYFTSCLYPFMTNLIFYLNDKPITDRNAYFNLTASVPIPYEQSAWAQYYANNRASVNDGLATKQKYDTERLDNNLNRDTKIANNNLSSGAISAGLSLVGGVADAVASIASFGGSGGLGSSIAGGVSGVINSTFNYQNQMLSAETDYSNGMLELEKERALLQISWNDKKSAPSAFSNLSSSLSLLYNKGPQCIEIDIYIAKNIDDIINYHKIYGYVLNRMSVNPLQDIRKHTVFDFISFNEITLGLELPQFYISKLEQMFESGVRFWYVYDNFLNYEIPNEDIA